MVYHFNLRMHSLRHFFSHFDFFLWTYDLTSSLMRIVDIFRCYECFVLLTFCAPFRVFFCWYWLCEVWKRSIYRNCSPCCTLFVFHYTVRVLMSYRIIRFIQIHVSHLTWCKNLDCWKSISSHACFGACAIESDFLFVTVLFRSLIFIYQILADSCLFRFQHSRWRPYTLKLSAPMRLQPTTGRTGYLWLQELVRLLSCRFLSSPDVLAIF